MMGEGRMRVCVRVCVCVCVCEEMFEKVMMRRFFSLHVARMDFRGLETWHCVCVLLAEWNSERTTK
jgi:hypothetical protein